MYLLLFLFWILINGKINLELTIFGLVICFFVYWFACLFLGFSFKKDLKIMKNIGLFAAYLVLTLIEVVKSNLNIITLILSKKTPEPEIVHFDVPLKSKFLRVVFANSITLTPGTITINVTANEYIVHALRPEYIKGIEDSILLKLLLKMEENNNGWYFN